MSEETRSLVRLSAVIAVGTEADIRVAMTDATRAHVPAEWIEEAILQSYLFAGFPRALNAAREWRRISGRPAPLDDEGMHHENVDAWRRRGEATCATVYGPFYERLRPNIRALHPALDEWMIVEGYGKVLSRPALDLGRRELCIIAVCAAGRQDRQLHSHLHGALHAGASASDIQATLDAVADMVDSSVAEGHRLLFARVFDHSS